MLGAGRVRRGRRRCVAMQLQALQPLVHAAWKPLVYVALKLLVHAALDLPECMRP